VFAQACRLGAEGIVSKKVDGTYQSGPCRVWIKVCDPDSIAVKRERSENWNKRSAGVGWFRRNHATTSRTGRAASPERNVQERQLM
jgi:hypothetical protein